MALKLSSCVKIFSSMPSKDKFELWLGEWIYQWGGRCLHAILVTIALLPFDTTVVPAHAHFRRCSAPASHNFGITRYPPSNKINGLQFQYRVTKLVLDKLFALGRDVCETRHETDSPRQVTSHAWVSLPLYRQDLPVLPWSIKPYLMPC